jgi:hypothetical protein
VPVSCINDGSWVSTNTVSWTPSKQRLVIDDGRIEDELDR